MEAPLNSLLRVFIVMIFGTLLTCECNEQVIEVNRLGTHSVHQSVGRSFPVNLLT